GTNVNWATSRTRIPFMIGVIWNVLVGSSWACEPPDTGPASMSASLDEAQDRAHFVGLARRLQYPQRAACGGFYVIGGFVRLENKEWLARIDGLSVCDEPLRNLAFTHRKAQLRKYDFSCHRQVMPLPLFQPFWTHLQR